MLDFSRDCYSGFDLFNHFLKIVDRFR